MQIITDTKREADLADAIVARTYEVYGYDINITNYEAIIASLPSEWPDRLLPLRNIAPHDAVGQCPDEDIELLSELQQYDRASYLVKTEKVERAKAQRVLDALDAQLTGPGRDAAIEAAVARRNQQMSVQP